MNPLANTTGRRGFTLVELLMVIGILAILSATILFALWNAQNDAKEARTKAVIQKIDALLRQRWDEYRTRTLRRPAAAMSPSALASWRVGAIRETMRMELPERFEDILFVPVTGAQDSTLRLSYLSQLTTTRTVENQGAECLYLILSNLRDGELSALEFLNESEVADTDGDGMLEVLDGWGNPLGFLRWAPGFLETWAVDASGDTVFSPRPPTYSVPTFQTTWRSDPNDPNNFASPVAAPDPFDPLGVEVSALGVNRHRDADLLNDPYMLYPLIYSGGRDGVKGIAAAVVDNSSGNYVPYPSANFRNDPYLRLDDVPAFALVLEPNDPLLLGFATEAAADNITNHYLEVQ